MPLDLSNGIKGKQTHCQFSKWQWNATQGVFLALHTWRLKGECENFGMRLWLCDNHEHLINKPHTQARHASG